MSGATGARVRRAAVRQFARKGFHGTGIRDLASAAQLSSASLYHYMGTKEALLSEIMRDSLERLLAAVELALEGARRPEERMARLVAVHVIAHALRPDETTVVDNEVRALSPAARRTVVALRDDYERAWAEAIADGAAAGVFAADDSGVARLALLQMCSGVARWYSPRGELSLDELAARYVRLALRALGYGGEPSFDGQRCRAVARQVWGGRA